MKHAALSLIHRSDGYILSVWNRRHQTYGLPGGKVEEGESLAEAQRRELTEETGLTTRFAAEVYAAPSIAESARIVHVFLVAPIGLERECEEGSPVAWVTLNTLIIGSKFAPFYKPMFEALNSRNSREQERVIPIVLFCPHCKKQHVDEGKWATRPHRTHACVDDVMGRGCGKAFTPSAHRTVGVLQTDLRFDPIEEPPR